MRRLASIVITSAALASGCGLLVETDPQSHAGAAGLDAETAPPPDAGPPDDAGPEMDARTEPPDADLVDATPADATTDRDCSFPIATAMPGPVPNIVDDGCMEVTVTSSGTRAMSPDFRRSLFDPHQILALIADGTNAQITFTFGRPVRNLYFRFDYLSTNASGRDERIEVRVDGVNVTPDLREPDFTYVSGDQILSTNDRGSGRVEVGTVLRLDITLLDLGSFSGQGIEIVELRYDRP